ncbi:phosphate ABC transporter, permease protein PstA [Candidatus Methanoperedens nitroreducens]|uniref:Phosphate transport system permease protein PstA n=1 Tax=Candidatus Methanoperedens nitratireducens TaxID=1392998 RepID=A0A062V6F4_9EURY|nr:phosphate ABC transporter permease PstA [Candidatus Methanoperedens nitroreducens]KCZ71364.1 phosphate ABC transporter, permease protein PstA [Candidatus Methanoperedens nitroreducens]MDJ1420993.1 phosphate ABC transporter permease PstA [Candidatus Methanoperedens sp.]
MRYIKGEAFKYLCMAATVIALMLLALLMWDAWDKGAGWLSLKFLNSFPSRFPEQAGIKSALWGSIWLMILTAIISIPLGVGAAIYLEEYARRTWLTRIIEINISNLAGVPSIVYGILGLALFVRGLMLGRSLLAGALTMALLILPIIIISSQEAIRAVPKSIREASYALGSTKWQTVRHHVLPAALPGILTGNILSLSRAMGEAAPLIMIGALTFIAFTPAGPFDPFTALPIQIFNWASRPKAEFQFLAAAGILVLLALLLAMNAAAIIIRNKYQRYIKW